MNRRRFVKMASLAVAVVPLAALMREARANTNPTIRAQWKYQAVPLDGKRCASCLEFIPGEDGKGLGRCKVIPGDDEISPDGYCTQWNTM